MGIGEATLNVLRLTSKFLDCPITTDTDFNSQRSLIIPQKFKIEHKGQTPFKLMKSFPVRWYIGNATTIGICTCYITGHCYKLLIQFIKTTRCDGNSKNHVNLLAEELMVYIFLVAMCIEALVIWWTMEYRTDAICFSAGELMRTSQVKYIGWPNRSRFPDLGECLGYMIALGTCVAFPTFFGIMPFIRFYGYVTRFLVALGFPETAGRKYLAGVVCAYITANGGVMSGTFVLILASGLTSLTKLAKSNLEMIENGRRAFREGFRFHSEMAILTQEINCCLTLAAPTLQAFAITFCVLGNYGLVKHSDKLLIELACIIILVEFTALIIVLLHFAAQLSVMTKQYIRFWKRNKERLRIVERKQLKGIQPISIMMGGFFSIKETTVLDVMSTVLDKSMVAVTL